jgi:hypothetical protein
MAIIRFVNIIRAKLLYQRSLYIESEFKLLRSKRRLKKSAIK